MNPCAKYNCWKWMIIPPKEEDQDDEEDLDMEDEDGNGR